MPGPRLEPPSAKFNAEVAETARRTQRRGFAERTS